MSEGFSEKLEKWLEEVVPPEVTDFRIVINDPERMIAIDSNLGAGTITGEYEHDCDCESEYDNMDIGYGGTNITDITDPSGDHAEFHDSTALTFYSLNMESDHTTINGVLINDHIRKEIAMNIYDPINLLIIALISLAVCKLIAPRVTIRWAAKKFKSLILLPFRQFKKEVAEELKED